MSDYKISPFTAWDSLPSRHFVKMQYYEWLVNKRNWQNFLTLTFREEKEVDVAMALFKRLIRYLNYEVAGKNYTRIVNHSYFSYILGIEFQNRGVVHFHVITDKCINYSLIHKLWNEWAGFAYISKIKDKEKTLSYIVKYITKGGNIEIYLEKRNFIPMKIFNWWDDSINESCFVFREENKTCP